MSQKRTRKPINMPTDFIERLNIINSLPEDIDIFLEKLSSISEGWRKQKILQDAENKIPEMYGKNHFHFEAEAKTLCEEFYSNSPNGLKKYLMKANTPNWLSFERLLNILAVERESLELIISMRKLENEFRQDFIEWKENRTDLPESEKEQYVKFQNLMKSDGKTRERFNADKYLVDVEGLKIQMPLPSVHYRLFYHRLSSIERTGFKGFLTHLTADGDFLDIDAHGLIGIILRRKLNGEPRIELDRLRYCQFCHKILYAYNSKKRFCSSSCSVANFQQFRRNDNLSLLKKNLKKEVKRLTNFQQRLDGDNGLIKEQQERVENLKTQIKEAAEVESDGNI